jgi:threonine synthase
VAGVTKAARARELDPDAVVVCVLTGNGLKDPTTAESSVTADVVEAEPTVAGVSRALGWGVG